MAEEKKSFILYGDILNTVSKLPDEVAGKLFKIILEYVNDMNPVIEDLLLQIAFEPIKLQLKRDLIKWEEFRKRQSENGKKGGRPVIPANPKNPSLFSETQKSLNVNVNDNDNVNVIKKEAPKLEEFNDYVKKNYQGLFSEIEESVILKYKSWSENSWVDGNGKKIKNWKSTILNTIPYLKKQTNATGKKTTVSAVAGLIERNS